MPTRTDYTPGTPNWVDLQTTDTDAAKKFYGDLLGWTYDDQPIDEANGVYYSMAKLNGHDVGAIAPLGEQAAAGVPPHWNSYVSVADVDATAALVAPAGGTVIMPPMDVMDAGRMAVIQDPTGAMLAIWQAKNHPGGTDLWRRRPGCAHRFPGGTAAIGTCCDQPRGSHRRWRGSDAGGCAAATSAAGRDIRYAWVRRPRLGSAQPPAGKVLGDQFQRLRNFRNVVAACRHGINRATQNTGLVGSAGRCKRPCETVQHSVSRLVRARAGNASGRRSIVGAGCSFLMLLTVECQEETLRGSPGALRSRSQTPLTAIRRFG